MTDTITLPDGRTLSYADYGKRGDLAVFWCHGGPGSRLEPKGMGGTAADMGLRMIGIDRPGYGLSSPKPGRSIADWVPDALALADHLKIDRLATIGVSTGGAYALALAAMAPERVRGVVACCALTDMRWAEGKAMMGAGAADLWTAPDRATAMARAEAMFGSDGSKMMSQAGGDALPPADMAMLMDPAFAAGWAESMGAMFAQGVAGYADDRIADGVGWGSFDVNAVSCPVAVVHGREDTICPPAHAEHTAKIVPGAELSFFDGLGHFSIVPKAVEALLPFRD
jgi:pimeloyl-ACP methyl ester carboxylesterase